MSVHDRRTPVHVRFMSVSRPFRDRFTSVTTPFYDHHRTVACPIRNHFMPVSHPSHNRQPKPLRNRYTSVSRLCNAYPLRNQYPTGFQPFHARLMSFRSFTTVLHPFHATRPLRDRYTTRNRPFHVLDTDVSQACHVYFMSV